MVASWRGDDHGVAQRQQVEADVHGQRVLPGEQGGRADQPVGTRADEEADVITDAQMIDARARDPGERRAPPRRIAVGRLQRVGEEPDADRPLTHRASRSVRARR